MLHGNIYPAEKVPQALSNFFREDNLAALRELTLRFLADETDDELIEHLRETPPGAVWETSERILVGVRAVPGTDAVIRRACRMAARLKADLHVLAEAAQPGFDRERMTRLAGEAGIDVHIIARQEAPCREHSPTEQQ